MVEFFLAFHGALAALRPRNDRLVPELALLGKDCQSLAVDPRRPQRIYCSTFGHGLWLSDDAGASWQPSAGELPYAEVMSVAVSPLENVGDMGVLWAGAEPSALFRSEDGGRSWQELPNLRGLPSSSTWSFPPRPWTHHVRWIEPDVNVASRIFVGIELGGVMRSLDGGQTWEDRKIGSQHDCHILRTHPLAPGRVYESAGGGFAESRDAGATWQGYDHGLRCRYLWGLAVDPGDPETMIVSASYGPRQAHDDPTAEATLYRRSAGQGWQPVYEGLPPSRGTRAYVLATHRGEPGVFYAATRHHLYRSGDGGLSWAPLAIEWPAGIRFNTVNALAVVEI
jgi:photosystem II stability/assembly factor-like uncharacterized protein